MGEDMAENQERPADQHPQDDPQKLKSLQLRIAIIATVIGAFWLFVNYLYDRTIGCGVDFATCKTQVAELELTLRTRPTNTQPTSIHTIEVTVVHTVIVTPTPVNGTAFQTPTTTRINYQTNGNCDAAISNTPCTYVLSAGDRWQQIAQDSPYGDNCRYPEILNLNRRPDGSYPRLSGYDSDLGRPITIMPAARYGSYSPRVRDELGEFRLVPECVDDGFPCVFTVTENLPLFTYQQVSQSIYQNNIFGETIADANLASDCSGKGVELVLGKQLVIPKRPLQRSTPSS